MTSHPALPPLPKARHGFQDPEGESPDIPAFAQEQMLLYGLDCWHAALREGAVQPASPEPVGVTVPDFDRNGQAHGMVKGSMNRVGEKLPVGTKLYALRAPAEQSVNAAVPSSSGQGPAGSPPTGASPPDQDGERYRWLVECKRVPWGKFLDGEYVIEHGIDAAIDAAREPPKCAQQP